MKKQKDYQLELAKRKYRKTNWIFYFIYYFSCIWIKFFTNFCINWQHKFYTLGFSFFHKFFC